MYHIRAIKTGSGSTAIQVIYYVKRKRIVFKHIGSGKTEEEIASLRLLAQDFINSYTPTIPFEHETKFDGLLFLSQSEFLGVYHTFLYEAISHMISQIGFLGIKQPVLLDLVIMRMVEPASKLRSIELMETYFGIRHRRQGYYQSAPKWLELKTEIEMIVTAFAKKHYAFNFDLLFYDVTTLYFEAFSEDELRKNGFSKDNKSQQPQILVALMVNKDGFPISYEIFAGNTFEGHTIIPVLNEFIRKHGAKEFTVVADAAMISASNIRELLKNNINYIVGARLGNLSVELTDQIDKKIKRGDGHCTRVKTENGYLICSFSSLRYRKDKYEMEKQIARARSIIETPSKAKKVKFTTTSGEKTELNQNLIDKTTKLLGIKGYYTNLEEDVADNGSIIAHYHQLYKIEQAFRISKNDLQTRPIFHFKEEPIKLHILVCFMALVISKHIELKTGNSIRMFITECKKITDARMLNKITGKETRIRTQLNLKINDYIRKLNLPH